MKLVFNEEDRALYRIIYVDLIYDGGGDPEAAGEFIFNSADSCCWEYSTGGCVCKLTSEQLIQIAEKLNELNEK